VAIKGNAPWLQSFNTQEKPGKTFAGGDWFSSSLAMFRKCLWRFAMSTLIRGLLVAAILTSVAITSVQAEDMFYIVHDKTMHG
jgi:hypothetical protein